MFDNVVFIFSSILIIGGTLGVVLCKNIMHACIHLLGVLMGVAGLYLTLGADFLAATQLIVYVGGVVILMLFAIMLTGGTENRFNRYGIEKIPAMGNMKTYLIGAAGVVIFAMITGRLIHKLSHEYGRLPGEKLTSTVKQIGTLLATDHVLAFEISSILLLGALVGAAVIARPRKGIE